MKDKSRENNVYENILVSKKLSILSHNTTHSTLILRINKTLNIEFIQSLFFGNSCRN